jgi:hypothetical protein
MGLSPNVQSLSPRGYKGSRYVSDDNYSDGRPARDRKVEMKKLLTRGLLGIAALAAPLGVSLALPMAAAHAAPGTTAATADLGTGPLPYNGTINGNLDVPAGVSFYINGGEVKGNVTVEGYLFAANAKFDNNVTVTGGHIQFNNQPSLRSVVKNNLTITGSDNNDWNGFWVGANIGNNFTYTGNAARLYVGATITVGHSFNYSGNAFSYDGGILAPQQVIS